MPRDFDSLQVVITGGTGALGTAVVTQLLDQGATCHIPCLHPAELDHFPHAKSPNVNITMGVNLTDEAQVQTFYAKAAQGRKLWASINIAGGFSYSPIAEVTKADFTKQWETNTLTAFLCCREATKHIRTAGQGGRLVNVTARPGLSPDQGANMTAYTAAKAAVAALTQALGAELAPEGIWINAVAPSIMDTPANRKSMPNADYGKWPKVEEVAKTICFLASPQNQTTRGGLVPVYGRA
jgi:NAD(P)-dependent dehydrogenase (short-subunit alcohol dehydrogenase family)